MAARISQVFRGVPRRYLRGLGIPVSRRLVTFPVLTVKAPQSLLKSGSTGWSSFSQRPTLRHQLAVVRVYSSSSVGDEGDEEGEEKKPADEQESDGDENLSLLPPVVKQYAIAPVSIPDRFPEVPVLPISRNPIFPRFVKMLEVCRCVCTILVTVVWRARSFVGGGVW